MSKYINGVKVLDGGIVENNVHFFSDIVASFGGASSAPLAKVLWETADANANALIFALPDGGAVNVPVVVFGDQSVLNADLGLFNGITDPSVAILSSDATKAFRLYHDGTYGTLTATGGIKTTSNLILSGNVFIDTQYLAMTINKPIYFGTDGKNGIKMNTAQTPDTMSIGIDGTGTYSRNFFLEELGDWGYDRAIASPTNPTFSIWSANQSQTERIYFFHDQTDAVVASGAGSVKLSPVTTVNINGGYKTKVVTKAFADTNYAIAAADHTIYVNTTGGIVNLILPAISATNEGQEYVIVDANYNAAVNNITLTRTGSDTINNVAGTYTISTSGAVTVLKANDTTNNWQII